MSKKKKKSVVPDPSRYATVSIPKPVASAPPPPQPVRAPRPRLVTRLCIVERHLARRLASHLPWACWGHVRDHGGGSEGALGRHDGPRRRAHFAADLHIAERHLCRHKTVHQPPCVCLRTASRAGLQTKAPSASCGVFELVPVPFSIAPLRFPRRPTMRT